MDINVTSSKCLRRLYKNDTKTSCSTFDVSKPCRYLLHSEANWLPSRPHWSVTLTLRASRPSRKPAIGATNYSNRSLLVMHPADGDRFCASWLPPIGSSGERLIKGIRIIIHTDTNKKRRRREKSESNLFISGHLSSSNVCWCLSASLVDTSLLFRQLRSNDFSIVRTTDSETSSCYHHWSLACFHANLRLVPWSKTMNDRSFYFQIIFPHYEVAYLWTQALSMLFGDLCLGYSSIRSLGNLFLRESSTPVGWFRIQSQHHWFERFQR